jgi:hypothetical protein
MLNGAARTTTGFAQRTVLSTILTKVEPAQYLGGWAFGVSGPIHLQESRHARRQPDASGGLPKWSCHFTYFLTTHLYMPRFMGVVDRKQELFENIVRLRRAGRELSSNRDIAAVRVALERELRETVSRRLAARVLGVSHTALDRWIKGGDLPVVYSPKGRMEVPVPALLDLHETVEAERAGGSRRYVLAPTMARRREAARHLRVDGPDDDRTQDSHDRARARSLAYHRAVARRLGKPEAAL